MKAYSENLVVALATAVALLDVFFILVAVPESLPEKVRPSSWGAPISWEQADPFAVSLNIVVTFTNIKLFVCLVLVTLFYSFENNKCCHCSICTYVVHTDRCKSVYITQYS